MENDEGVYIDKTTLFNMFSYLAFFGTIIYNYIKPYDKNKKEIYYPGVISAAIGGFTSSYYFWKYPEILYLDFSRVSNTYFKPYVYYMRGYSLTEALLAIKDLDPGYIIHGTTLFIVLSYMIYTKQAERAIVPLLAENSTIWLNLYHSQKSIYYALAFAYTFLYYRWYIFPLYCWNYYAYFNDDGNYTPFVVIFNSLNLFWGIKIINKIYTKFSAH